MQNFENSYEQYELSPEFGSQGETYELNPEYNETSYEFNNEEEFINEIPVYEVTQLESEMAFELGTVSNEEEFGSFLKGLAQKALGAAGNFLSSPTGQTLTNKLTDIAKKTIPSLGKTMGTKAGSYLGGRLGSAVGSRIGGAAGAGLGQKIGSYGGGQLGAYGGEKLGGIASDKAVNFIRFATDSIKNAAASNRELLPEVSASNAIVNAAKKYYPQILGKRCTCRSTQNTGTVSPGMGKDYNQQGRFNQTGSTVTPGMGKGFSREEEYGYETSYEDEYSAELNSEINGEGIFNEQAEIQLASELLAINNEAELDMFLGGLLKKAAGAAKAFAKSSAGKALGGALKGLAKKALPIVGSTLGNMVVPGLGGMIGGKLGSFASKMFEIQGEGLSQEDREFQTARSFVRFAGNAARRASRMRPNMNPKIIANNAITESARLYAPGILRSNDWFSDSNGYGDNSLQQGTEYSGQNGSWFRQGNSIILRGI